MGITNTLNLTKSRSRSIGDILSPRRTREPNNTHFSLAHPKKIPLIGNPIDVPTLSHHSSDKYHGIPAELDHAADGHDEHHHDSPVEGEPPLKRNHESSVIQLFYDLFFVANLTTFTQVHEVTDVNAFKSYVGYFAMLWFTWFQVAIFDVRFGVDSVVERFCKLIQFGVMTGFAVVGPSFQTGDDDEKTAARANQAFRTLSLILMVSRLVLAAQYAVVVFFCKGYKRAILPLILHVSILTISGFVFLGTYFAFSHEANGTRPLIGWYIILAFEAISILAVSGLWKFLSFRKTCIVERLGLLTLIILGEGVIGLCLSVQKVGDDSTWTSDLVGLVISSIIVIFSMWMLYFDQAETNAVGTLRQQAWTLVHFPYHMGILFLVEGCSQLTTWNKVNDTVNNLTDLLSNSISTVAMANPSTDSGYAPLPGISSENLVEFAKSFNETLRGFYEQFESSSNKELSSAANYTSLNQWVGCIQDYAEGWMTSAANQTDFDNIAFCAEGAELDAIQFVASNIGFQGPEVAKGQGGASYILALVGETYRIVFLYFFGAAIIALAMTGILLMLGKRRKVLTEWMNIGFRFVICVGLTIILAVTAINPDGLNDPNASLNALDASGNWFGGTWPLPTVAIVLLIVVIVDHLLREWSHKIISRRNMAAKHSYPSSQGSSHEQYHAVQA